MPVDENPIENTSITKSKKYLIYNIHCPPIWRIMN